MAKRYRSNFSAETTGINLKELAFLEDILEQLPVGVVVISPNSGQFLFANSRAAQILGHQDSEAIVPGRAWEETPLLADARPLGDRPWPLDRTLSTGEVISGQELMVRRADGRAAVLRVHVFPIVGAGKRALSVVMTFSDITQTKEAEAALRESEERYRSLVDCSPEPIAVHSGGVVVYLNEAGARLLGADSPGEVIGRPVLDFVPPDQVEMIKGRMRRVLEEGWAPLIEEQFLRLDGRSVDVEVVAVRVSYQGRLASQMVIRDISARKRAERARQLLTRAGVVLSSTLDFHQTLDNAARLGIPSVADACLLEVEEEGQHVPSQVIALADREEEARLRRRLRRHSGHALCLQPQLEASGTDHPLMLTGEAALNALVDSPNRGLAKVWRSLAPQAVVVIPLAARRQVTGTMTFLQLGEEPRLSEEDLPALEELGRRTAVAIDNARLYREMQEADRRKDEFLAMLAHELRNPLAAISGAIEVLGQDGGQPETLHHARAAADRQLGNMTRLLDDLLEVSRITQGKIQLRREAVLLGDPLDQSIRACGELLKTQGHELKLVLLEAPLTVQADPSRLEQIFTNLLNNAAKYTPPRGVLELSTALEDGMAVIRVKDNGVGIAREVLPHVFDLFVQGESTLDRAQGGLGIGLTLVRRLVEMHGGQVSAKSDGPGTGSEFTVLLPVKGGKEPTPRRPAPPQGAVSVNTGRRVLLVDDNLDVAVMLATLLRGDGHEVEVAHDGPAALEAAKAWKPAVVLLDIGLPAMDGYQVARGLRKREGGQELLIIAITGYCQGPDREKALKAGFDHYLVKPVPMARLRAILAQ